MRRVGDGDGDADGIGDGSDEAEGVFAPDPGAALALPARPLGVAPRAATPGVVDALLGAEPFGRPGIGSSAPGGIGPPRKLSATATP